MKVWNDDEVLRECESINDTERVRSLLHTGYFSTCPGPATEWLYRRDEQERRENARLMRWTAWSSIGLAICAVFAIAVQIFVARAQSADAKELLAAQISVELDRQFDSTEMRQARRRFASQLLNKTEVSELRVLDFFEKVGMYQHQKRIDLDTVDRAYSYWVERYWLAAKGHIEQFRHDQRDSGFYSDFEELNRVMLAFDASVAGKQSGPNSPRSEEVQRFLKEEAELPQ